MCCLVLLSPKACGHYFEFIVQSGDKGGQSFWLRGHLNFFDRRDSVNSVVEPTFYQCIKVWCLSFVLVILRTDLRCCWDLWGDLFVFITLKVCSQSYVEANNTNILFAIFWVNFSLFNEA